MDTRLLFDHQPTDMMHRRSQLLFRGCFFWLGTNVTICTDLPDVLDAAEKAGLRLRRDSEQVKAMRWEIVGELQATEPAQDWECEVTLDDHSLYLSMGPRQWFAFDRDTGDGAGFAAIANPDRPSEPNAERYLRAVLETVGTCLQSTSSVRRR
jgi:hypothetical protein